VAFQLSVSGFISSFFVSFLAITQYLVAVLDEFRRSGSLLVQATNETWGDNNRGIEEDLEDEVEEHNRRSSHFSAVKVGALLADFVFHFDETLGTIACCVSLLLLLLPPIAVSLLDLPIWLFTPNSNVERYICLVSHMVGWLIVFCNGNPAVIWMGSPKLKNSIREWAAESKSSRLTCSCQDMMD
jgi:hypothetical protein